MTPLAIHFVDPTIPGISGRDLARRTAAAIEATWARAERLCATAHCAAVMRRGLSDLDRNQLRDIGLDRGAT